MAIAFPQSIALQNPNFSKKHRFISSFSTKRSILRLPQSVNGSNKDSDHTTEDGEEVDSVGVKAALSMLRFYKREISPLMPNSCRYVPTCSEYSMIAYKKYGLLKGSILTAYRLSRCNPLGGSGFDPPRWFDETDQSDKQD